MKNAPLLIGGIKWKIQESWLQRTAFRKKLPKTSKNFPPIFENAQTGGKLSLKYWNTSI